MSRASESVQVLRALDQRVLAAAAVLLPRTPDVAPGSGPGAAASATLPLLVDTCARSGSTADVWLLLVAVEARLPRATEVHRLHHQVRSSDPTAVVTAMLSEVLADRDRGNLRMEMDLVVGGVVVNADWCSRNEKNTGIQRVVRRTLPRWEAAGHVFVTTAWTDANDAPRTISAVERHRVFEHGDAPALEVLGEEAAVHEPRLVVPWRSDLVLLEVPHGDICHGLAAIGELSGNRVSAIGYDAIPLVEAHLRSHVETGHFLRYLSTVKHAERVAGISESATTEFAGFVDALVAQGLRGPAVSEVLLPTEAPAAGAERRGSFFGPGTGTVHVLCVGSMEPHKNHAALLYAVERLWREGLDLDLTLIGGPGWNAGGVQRRIEHLVAEGRPLRHLGSVGDADLAAAYRDADLSVFVSLHEGFGLPVVESLASGTPVLTSDHGSMAEIARGGGALTVDPRDDEAIVAALRSLVASPELRKTLAEAALARPARGWDDYARELWDTLVGAEVTA